MRPAPGAAFCLASEIPGRGALLTPSNCQLYLLTHHLSPRPALCLGLSRGIHPVFFEEHSLLRAENKCWTSWMHNSERSRWRPLSPGKTLCSFDQQLQEEQNLPIQPGMEKRAKEG